jgi:hypothetical protein
MMAVYCPGEEEEGLQERLVEVKQTLEVTLDWRGLCLVVW